MKLKETIERIEEKLKIERNEELDKVLKELKKIDEEVKESEARNRAVDDIKRKNNDILEWYNFKDV